MRVTKMMGMETKCTKFVKQTSISEAPYFDTSLDHMVCVYVHILSLLKKAKGRRQKVSVVVQGQPPVHRTLRGHPLFIVYEELMFKNRI